MEVCQLCGCHAFEINRAVLSIRGLKRQGNKREELSESPKSIFTVYISFIYG